MHDVASQELRCFPVTYNRSFPQLPHYLGALGDVEKGDLVAFGKLFFCWKSSDWSGEQEWRFFASSAGTSVEFETSMLSGIVFGWKMPRDTRDLIRAWTSQYDPQPQLFQAEPYADRFRMKLSSIG